MIRATQPPDGPGDECEGNGPERNHKDVRAVPPGVFVKKPAMVRPAEGAVEFKLAGIQSDVPAVGANANPNGFVEVERRAGFPHHAEDEAGEEQKYRQKSQD